jgi:hypothetical protein
MGRGGTHLATNYNMPEISLLLHVVLRFIRVNWCYENQRGHPDIRI